jgi:hypothetical protein
MAKSLIRSVQLHPDVSGLVGAYGSGFFPPLSSVDNLVYTTGDQTITGIKTFEVRPTVTGLSVLLSGDYAAVPPNIVYASGAQTISGLKTFYLRPEVNGSGVVLTGDGVLYDVGNQTITGLKNYVERPTFQGTGFLTYADTGNFNITVEVDATGVNIVYKTGQQHITGRKHFVDQLHAAGDILIGSGAAPYSAFNPSLTIDSWEEGYSSIKLSTDNTSFFNITLDSWDAEETVINNVNGNRLRFSNSQSLPTEFDVRPEVGGVGVLLQGEGGGGGVDYSFHTTNWTLTDSELYIGSSTVPITGTLPPATSGVNFRITNVNSAVVVVASDGSETIDGLSTNAALDTYDSIHIVGVNNIGYTGWITMSADGGLS